MTTVDYMVGMSLKQAYQYIDKLTEEQFTKYTDNIRMYARSYTLNVLEHRPIEDRDVIYCEGLADKLYSNFVTG